MIHPCCDDGWNPRGRVFGDVGDPQLVGRRAGEVPFDEIRRSRCLMGRSTPLGAGQTLQAGSGHEHLDGVMPDGDTHPEGQIGVDSSSPIGSSRRRV